MRRHGLAPLVLFALVACAQHAHADAQPGLALRIVARAREEAARGVRYDPSYERIAYPMGDVDPARGACTDVVVRALRAAGVDLQQRIHEDALAHPDAYPHIARPDASIDHRRVPGVRAWMMRHAQRLPTGTARAEDRASWHAGDVVVWNLGLCPACRPRHVGIVSDRMGQGGLPLVIHNIGPVAREEEALTAWTIVGHYRVIR